MARLGRGSSLVTGGQPSSRLRVITGNSLRDSSDAEKALCRMDDHLACCGLDRNSAHGGCRHAPVCAPYDSIWWWLIVSVALGLVRTYPWDAAGWAEARRYAPVAPSGTGTDWTGEVAQLGRGFLRTERRWVSRTLRFLTWSGARFWVAGSRFRRRLRSSSTRRLGGNSLRPNTLANTKRRRPVS